MISLSEHSAKIQTMDTLQKINLQWCMRIMKYSISVDPLNSFGTIKTIILYVIGMATLTYYIILSSNLSVIGISPALMRKR